jgi:hypothetical protein
MTLLDGLFLLGLLALALLIAIAVGTWIDGRARKRKRPRSCHRTKGCHEDLH